MGTVITLTIDMDAKCVECRKKGATPSGLCLVCVRHAMDKKRVMKSPQGRALQTTFFGEGPK